MKLALLISTKGHSPAWFSAPVLALLLQAGCATIDRYEPENLKRAVIAALPADSSVYLYVNLRRGEEFARSAAALSTGDFLTMSRLFDDGESVYLAAASPALETVDWTLIAVGKFPAGVYSAALDLDGGWKRGYGSGRIWVSADRSVEIAVPSSQVVVAARRDVQSVINLLRAQIAGSAAPPGRFHDILVQNSGRDLVAYTVEPESFLPFELPGEVAFECTATVFGDFVDDSLEAELLLRFSSAAQARVSGLLIKTLIIAQTRKTVSGVFNNAVVQVEGELVTVSSLLIEPRDIEAYLTRSTSREVTAR